MKLAALNEYAAAARLRVDALEEELAAAYLAALRAAGRKAAGRFRGAVTVKSITAATDPTWVPPDPGALLDEQQLAAQAQKKAAPIQERALKLAVPVGIAFDTANPLAQQFLSGLADRSTRILGGYSNEIGAAVGDAYEQGLSVAGAAQLIRARVESASLVQATLLARSDLVSIANGGSLLGAQLVAQASVGAGEGAANFKTWLTAGDERVRDTHAEADGQTVPLDQPFDVGGESLMYPGDPDGSLEETLNCRCVTVYGDSMTAALVTASRPEVIRVSQEDFDAIQRAAVRAPTPALSSAGTMDETPEVTVVPPVLRDFHLTAAAGEPTRWQATLLVEDEPTEDGRMIAANGATWRPLPLPLSILDDSSHSDTGEAPVCGRIDQIWRAGSLIQAAGVFDTGPIGVEAERLVTERMITGISCDGVCTASEIVVTRKDDAQEDQALEDEVDGVIGGDPVVDETYDEDLEYLFVATEYVIMGATICPAGAIAQARIDVVTAAADREGETWLVHAPFAPSRCEVPAVGGAADPVKLEALTASVEAMTESHAGLARAVEDRLGSVDAQQRAIIAHFVAMDEHFKTLSTVKGDIAALRTLAEKKPRHVEFKRDGEGRLAGLIEE